MPLTPRERAKRHAQYVMSLPHRLADSRAVDIEDAWLAGYRSASRRRKEPKRDRKPVDWETDT